MWIKSQDKTELSVFIKFKVVSVFSGIFKGYLYGYFAGSSLFHINSTLLGKYETVEEAKEVLKDIEEAILNKTEIYEMK